MRKKSHIRNFEPGTLVGSELNLAILIHEYNPELVDKMFTVPGEPECS